MSLPEINELSRLIARSDAEDESEQSSIIQSIVALRDRVQGDKAHDVRLRLDAALHLTSYINQMGGSGGDEILRIVSRLVASLDSYFQPTVRLAPMDEAETGLPRPPSPAPTLEPAPTETAVSKQATTPPALPGASMYARGPKSNSAGHESLSQEVEQEHDLISDMLLGEILVQFGTINSAQVCEALELQNDQGMRFGDALIKIGAANRGDIQSAVGYQESLRREAAGETAPAPSAALPAFRPVRGDLKLVSDMMLGDLLVKMGRVSAEQLELGLRTQRATGVRIGEALVEIGAVSWADIKEALRIQGERRVTVL